MGRWLRLGASKEPAMGNAGDMIRGKNSSKFVISLAVDLVVNQAVHLVLEVGELSGPLRWL